MAGAAFAAVNATAGAAAPKSQVGIVAATVRCRVRGFHIGNTAATSAAGLRFILNRTTVGTEANTPITTANTRLDNNSPNPSAAAHSTYTAEPTAGVTVTDVGFDRVGTYILWYPPGVEPFATGTTRLTLQKTVGTDTDIYGGTLYWAED
jgi:hypothetical protein